MTLLIKCRLDDFQSWSDAFHAEGLPMPVRHWSTPHENDDVKYAFVWSPEPGRLKQLANLDVIFSMAAGIDHILADTDLPDKPIVRLALPELSQRMSEYVALSTLFLHRQWQGVLHAGKDFRAWSGLHTPLASERTVGFLGLGELGEAAARSLMQLGFNVRAWCRTPRTNSDIEIFAGREALNDFLSKTEILVCLLPLTDDTRDLLSKDVFDAMPKGSALINVGRGAHLVEADLLAALDSGQLSSAVMDVFRQEPLPADHPFWSHPKITITPHIASVPTFRERARSVVNNIRRRELGQEIGPLANRGAGY